MRTKKYIIPFYTILIFLFSISLRSEEMMKPEGTRLNGETEQKEDSSEKESKPYKPFSINFSTTSGKIAINDRRRFPAETEYNYERSLFLVGSFTPGMDTFSRYMYLYNKSLPREQVPAWANHNRFYLEYRPRKHGISIGYSSSNYAFKEDETRLDNLYYLSILNAHSANPTLLYQIFAYVEMNREKDMENEKRTISFGMIELAYSFHLTPEKKWDPYMSFGIKSGGCEDCGAAGAFAEAGFRYNFKHVHIAAGLHHQSLYAESSSNKDKNAFYEDTGLLFNIGIHI